MTTATLATAPAAATMLRRPRALTVLRLQFLLLWRTRRVALLSGLLFGSLALIEFVTWHTAPDVTSTSIAAGLLPLLTVLGLAWSMIVWREEEPHRRHYHWSLPVDTTVHDTLRVAAGGLWLVAILMVFYGAVYALAAVHGNVEDHPLGVRLALSFVLVPLLVYMLMSVVTIASGRPLYWLVGLYVALVVFALVVVEQAGGLGLAPYFRAVFGPRQWGLTFALSGGGGVAPLGMWLSTWLLWLVVSAAGIVGVSVARRGRS